MRIRHQVLFILLALVLAGGARVARAQDEDFLDPTRAKPMPPDQQRKIMLRDAAKEAEMLKARPGGAIRQLNKDVEVRPVLNARGEQLVGVIEQRTMTKNQLATRVNLIVQRLPDIQDGNPKERAKKLLDRRVNLEGRILDEWERATVLAVAAEKLGYKATAQEVEQAIASLSAQNVVGPGDQSPQQMFRMIGIPDSELRQEVSDGIIVEKMLRDQIDKIPDEGLTQVFNKSPQIFLEPTRVSAWELVATMLNNPTDAEVKQIKKVMNGLSKRLNKCKKQEDYEALQKELAADREAMVRKLNGQTDITAIKANMGQYKGILLVYLDKVASTGYRLYRDPVRPEVSKELFSMKPGKMSDLIASPAPPKKTTEFHIVKLVERVEGHKGTFAEAKPQIKNLMLEKLKEVVFENIMKMNNYDIRTDPAGLTEYLDKSGRVAAAATPAPTPTPAPASRAGLAAAGTQRNPFQPGRAGHSIFEMPVPSVESVVGAKAEEPAPGTTIAPSQLPPNLAAQQPSGASDKPAAPANAAPAAGAAPAPDAAPAVLGAVAPPPQDAAAPTPTPRPTPASRRRRSRPAPNYNVNPPSVDDVLSHQDLGVRTH